MFVVKDGRVLERQVQLGQNEGDMVEIKWRHRQRSVATSNLEQLGDGTPVKQ